MKKFYTITIMLLLIFMPFYINPTFAQIPNTLNYQGYLCQQDGTPVADGSYSITFKIYDSSDGSIVLWSELINNVETVNGIFNVIFGKTTSINIPFDKTYWLGISIGSNSELKPRIEFTSSAYTFRSKIAEGLAPEAKGIVTSINDIEGVITLEAGSNTTIEQNNQVITISASSSGIQGIQNIDENLSITNPNGPIATIKFSENAKAIPSGSASGDLTGIYPNPTIANNAVSTNKIADGSITQSKLASNFNYLHDHYGATWNSTGKDFALKLINNFTTTNDATGLTSECWGTGLYPAHAIGVRGIGYNNSQTGEAIGGWFSTGDQGSGPHGGIVGVAHGSSNIIDNPQGNVGVYGESNNLSSGKAYGGLFTTTEGGSGKQIGVYGEVKGGNEKYGGYFITTSSGSGPHYGISTEAIGGSTSYGIYSKASGGNINWAGYFQGNVNIQGNLTVTGTVPISSHASTHNVGGSDQINVTSTMISNNAVTSSKISIPLYLSGSPSDYILNATTTGTLPTAGFIINNSNNSYYALYSTTNGSGEAFYGNSTGSGSSGVFEINNSNNSSYALYGYTNGLGQAGHFTIANSNNSNSALNAVTNGKGYAGYFQISNSSNSNPALYATTNGSGYAVYGYQNGTGSAGYYQISNSSNSNPALYVTHNGAGHSIYGYQTGSATAGLFYVNNSSSSNAALWAYTNGSSLSTGFYCTNYGSGDGIYTNITGGGWAARFYGSGSNSGGVYISAPTGHYGLNVASGTKSAVVRTSQGARLLYCEESSEVWFSDYGISQLINGQITIPIEPLFAETVNLNEDYLVFIQVRGNAQVYTTDFTFKDFKVKLISGDPNVKFSYKIQAKRKGYEKDRLNRMESAEDDPNLYPEKRAEWEAKHLPKPEQVVK